MLSFRQAGFQRRAAEGTRRSGGPVPAPSRFEDCRQALASAPIEYFRPKAGDTLCIQSSTDDPAFDADQGPIVGYAHIVKVTGTLKGSLSVKAAGWYVTP
ncbi:hypothetical protein M1L60_35335 [Actinoplanes sp. TRM 88003]|uniref:Uncharacterized protein n=1 Tax=Paractinoplanes aksuensis TaxID=2939490 RepID=A0ABT1DYC0_9ACTN|nr:hypothetical protein [Actinoplanes aksuensis]MCO8275866.1 hypothetical protein [Actinoplanes aksuensis]